MLYLRWFVIFIKTTFVWVSAGIWRAFVAQRSAFLWSLFPFVRSFVRPSVPPSVPLPFRAKQWEPLKEILWNFKLETFSTYYISPFKFLFILKYFNYQITWKLNNDCYENFEWKFLVTFMSEKGSNRNCRWEWQTYFILFLGAFARLTRSD